MAVESPSLVGGFAGNALPLTIANSSAVVQVDYMLGDKYVISDLSTAQTVTLTSSQNGWMFTYGACASGVTITLPAPIPGLHMTFLCTGSPTSAATRWNCATSGAFVLTSDSGGADAVAYGSTATELGAVTEFIALPSSKWFPRRWPQNSSVAPTTNSGLIGSS